MLPTLARTLPRPGPLWGSYPLRAADDRAPAWRGLAALRPALAQARRTARRAGAETRAWSALPPHAWGAALQALRRRLRRDGWTPAALAQALGAAAAGAAATLAQTPRQTQLLAAAVLLDQRLAEMATGEGKTLAIALAAAVAALAGVPVHVVTANDYLAARDAAQLAPLFRALGLTVAARPGAADDDARRAVYRADIVYATAKDLAFDFLRDRLAGAGRDPYAGYAAALGGSPVQAPVLRGLCLALIDEADSILLDEAEVPLILSHSRPQAARRAFLWQALALARQLHPLRDVVLHPAERQASLTPDGEQRLAALANGLGGPWQRPRYRREAVQTALVGLHLLRLHEHYVVRDGAVELLDEVTGRAAPGRVWSRGLHTVVALKEGLHPPDETDTVARTSFQRFFQRYWRLAGLSGTLWEARAELRAVYGLPVCRIPLHQRSRRRTLPARRFAAAGPLFDAAAGRAAELAAHGRPVLLGTDSVADSQALSTRLAARGLPHQVLNALHDADEAAIVAAAGRAGCVTVATRMAGRGTDIVLDAAAHAAGGLHVLSCQHNPSRRLDRQLAGRAGRHGEPGSTEAWTCARLSPQDPAAGADTLLTWTHSLPPSLRAWLAWSAHAVPQWLESRRRAALRRELLRQDLEGERRLAFGAPPG
ncbi:MAG: hypothetical protein OEW22_00105 [Rubrivivax sp.]|nr:hypothetical protein [Rubrivivax sp.]